MHADLERLLNELTPQRLRQLILDLARRQPPDTRAAVSLHLIVDALLGDSDLGSGETAWEAQLRLQQAIRDTVAHIAGMQYVEGDA